MNGARYNRVVKMHIAKWRRACFGRAARVFLVKDHERCLWQERNANAEHAAGFDVIDTFPKASPDLNAIEGWWRRLKDALVESAPPRLESRQDFLKRLRSTVNRLNRIACDDGLRLCTNQRARR